MKYTKLTAYATFAGNFITIIVAILSFYFSDSAAVLYTIFISLSGIICSILTLLVIREREKGHSDKFPYGTNRLENFNALVISVIILSCVVVSVVFAVRSILHDPHILNNFVTIPLSLIIAFSTQFWIYFIAKKGMKHENSPILIILGKDAKIGTYRNLASFVVVLTLWVISIDDIHAHYWIDKGLALTFAMYGSFIYLGQIISDSKSLSDFPLKESEQLFILNILSRYFNEYENIGRIYSTTKGNDFFVEVELKFNTGTKLDYVLELQKKMHSDFINKYPGGNLKIIPGLSE